MTGLRRHAFCVFLVSAMLIISVGFGTPPGTTEQIDSGEPFYYSDGRKIPLTPARDHIAIRSRELGPADIAARFPELSARARSDLLLNRLSLYRLDERLSTETHRALVEKFGVAPEIELAAPVFEANGALTIVTDEFIAKFVAGASPEILLHSERYPGVEIVEAVSWDANTYRLRVEEGNALEVANRFHERPEVVYAQPDFVRVVRRGSSVESLSDGRIVFGPDGSRVPADTPISHSSTGYRVIEPVAMEGRRPDGAPLEPEPLASEAQAPVNRASIKSEDFEGVFPNLWDLSGSPTWGEVDFRSYSGDWSGYSVGSGVAPPGPYRNNTNAWMVYGPFNLFGAKDARVNLQAWVDTESDDFFYVVVDDGIGPTQWYGRRWSGDLASDSGEAGWMNISLDLKRVPTLGDLRGHSAVSVALVFQSDGAVSSEGVYVDDVVIEKISGVYEELTSDTYDHLQWSLSNNEQLWGLEGADIRAADAWGVTHGSEAITIAVIDDGVDLTHPDLAAKLLPGYDATLQGSAGGASRDDAYGTACSGIAAAVTDNALGVAGIAREARILPVRVGYTNSAGGFVIQDSWIADGINWATAQGTDVLSNSWYLGSPSTAVTDAIANAKTNGREGKGAVVVFAAGDDNGAVTYPAVLDTVLAVGALSPCDERKAPTSCDGEYWWGSNYGSELDLSAPGVNMYTTDLQGAAGFDSGDYYYNFSGTLSAAPVVAGVAALVLGDNPALTAAELESRLELTADDLSILGWDAYTGYGRVNAYRALTESISPCHLLTLSHTGEGSDPVASPDRSAGCSSGRHIAGEEIQLAAGLAPGWSVRGWTGTDDDASTATSNSVTMPAGDHEVSVQYVDIPTACYPLTVSHSGSGSDPAASPASSPGCLSGEYIGGEAIGLLSDSSAGWTVAGWSGTDYDESTLGTNLTTMPAGAHNVAVSYVEVPVGYWSSGGPAGGAVHRLAMAPSDPDVLYAGTAAGIYKSADGAASWIRTGFASLPVRSLKVSAVNPAVVYAGTEDGIYKSEDGGRSWSYKGLDTVNAIAIRPDDPQIVLAGTGKLLTYGLGKIFRSTDGAESWLEVAPPPGMSSIEALLFDTQSSSIVYAAGEASNVFGWDNRSGVLKSTDGGLTWESRNVSGETNRENVTAIAMTATPVVPSVLYAYDVEGLNEGLFKSVDKGETWSTTGITWGSIFEPWSLAVDPIDSHVVYLGSGGGLLKSTDGGVTWSTLTSGLPDGTPSSIVVDPRDSDRIYVSFPANGVYRSLNGGATWTASNYGMQSAHVAALTVDPTSSETVLAAVKEGLLSHTSDGGAFWDAWSHAPSYLGAVTIDPGDPDVIWAGDGLRWTYSLFVHKSTDGGISWDPSAVVEVVPDRACMSVTDIWVDPNDTDIVLVAVRSQGSSCGDVGGVWRTIDGGTHWSQSNSHWMVMTLAGDPDQPGVVYWATRDSGQVFRSTDSGASFAIIPGGSFPSDADVSDLEVDTNSDLYAATNKGLWRWDGSWSQVAGLPAPDLTAVALDRTRSPGDLYVGSGEGVHRRPGGESSWTPFNEGLETQEITKLMVSPSEPKILYAGTTHGGVWSARLAPPACDLATTKADSADPVIQGGALTYSLTVTNNGPSEATGVTVTDTLPAGVSYIGATPSQGSCTEASGIVRCELGNIANSSTAAVSIGVTANQVGLLTNTATVSANEADTTTSNNTATEETTVKAPAGLVGDRVWLDSNVNGLQDAGERGVAGIPVRLLASSGAELDTTATDAGGNYQLAGLAPGDYSVHFALSAGYLLTAQNQGADDTLDSDPNPDNGRTAVTNIAANENDASWDAGLAVDKLVTIGVSHPQYSPAGELVISLLVHNKGSASKVDFYIGILLPDGNTIVCFADMNLNFAFGSVADVSTLKSIAPETDLSFPFTLRFPTFFKYTWPSSGAPGSYMAFLVATRPGAFNDGVMNPGDIVDSSTAPFTFSR